MKEVLPRLSLAGNLEKPLMSLYGTEWRDVAVDSVKKICEKKKEEGGGGMGAQHRYILMMTENPPEQLNQ